jgi:lysophospholipase L1-like esterase
MLDSSRGVRVLRAGLSVLISALAVALVSGCSTTGGSIGSTGASSTLYYLALGDSLSVGVQPTKTGDSILTDSGYVNDLYAHYRAIYPTLRLIQMGCPGDTTASLVSGQGNTVAAKRYHCDRDDGSQLNAAVAFITAHRSQVKLITVDIGTNDVDDCLTGAVVIRGLAATTACIDQGARSIRANAPKLVDTLKTAVAPGTALVAGTIYDSFLAARLATGAQDGTVATRVADASPALIGQVNAEIEAADAGAGFKTANVAGAFDTDVTTAIRSRTLGGSYPEDVVALCENTWACAKAPRGPNIHPDTAGYRTIAQAYERALGATL